MTKREKEKKTTTTKPQKTRIKQLQPSPIYSLNPHIPPHPPPLSKPQPVFQKPKFAWAPSMPHPVTPCVWLPRCSCYINRTSVSWALGIAHWPITTRAFTLSPEVCHTTALVGWHLGGYRWGWYMCVFVCVLICVCLFVCVFGVSGGGNHHNSRHSILSQSCIYCLWVVVCVVVPICLSVRVWVCLFAWSSAWLSTGQSDCTYLSLLSRMWFELLISCLERISHTNTQRPLSRTCVKT